MKLENSNRRRLFFTLMLAMVAFGLSVVETDAQTKRRKRVPVKSPVVSATQPPQTEPLIISRAEDFPDSESQTITPAATQGVIELNSTGDNNNSRAIEELSNRIKNLESGNKTDYDTKQKRLLLNLDILTRAEQRAETLRKQLFDMIEKESTIKTRLDLIESDIRPDTIDRSVAFAGSLRPEELRDMRRKSLTSEKTNLQTLLTEIQRTRFSLDQNVQKADILVEKFRSKLEKEIDDALIDDPVEEKKPSL